MKLKKYDTKKMYEIYDKWPEFSKKAYESQHEDSSLDPSNHVVFAGIGGSGAIGDIFSSILSKTNTHVSVVKGYHLPKTVDSKTLVITTSVSGNSAETLSCLNLAKKNNNKIIAFSSGGKMRKICEKNKIQHVEIPQLHSPRASFTVYLYTMLKVLKKTIPIDNNDIYESIQKLQLIRKKICSSNLTESNTALNLAEWIIGIPLIYYPYGLQACATRFKNSLQENAKMHALAEDILEASHNGIVSWERKSKVQPIILRGKDDYIKTKERWQIFKEYFKKNDIEYQEIMSVNGSILSKLITLIYLLDYCSIYKAALSNIDPTPIYSIDYIKKRL